MEDDPLAGAGLDAEQTGVPRRACARSRCRSPTSPGPRPSSRAGSACAAPTPRCEPLSTRRSGGWPARGHAAACSPPAASSSSSCSTSIRSGGRAPADYRISDQGILNIAFGARSRRDHGELYRRARAAGARANRRPLHLPGGGVVYVNDPDGFSVELLWMSPASEKRWGFTPRPAAQAAAGGHARRRADGADRRARPDHVGCDRGSRDGCRSGSASARCAGRSRARRSRTVAGPSGC